MANNVLFLKVHGYVFSSDSDSGSNNANSDSDFDEEYYKLKPPPLLLDTNTKNIFVIKSKSTFVDGSRINNNLRLHPKKYCVVNESLQINSIAGPSHSQGVFTGDGIHSNSPWGKGKGHKKWLKKKSFKKSSVQVKSASKRCSKNESTEDNIQKLVMVDENDQSGIPQNSHSFHDKHISNRNITKGPNNNSLTPSISISCSSVLKENKANSNIGYKLLDEVDVVKRGDLNTIVSNPIDTRKSHSYSNIAPCGSTNTSNCTDRGQIEIPITDAPKNINRIAENELESVLRYWTDEEKEQLLNSLNKHGSSNTALIASEIPTRTHYEVQVAIMRYERVAIDSLKKSMNTTAGREAPLDKWMAFLKEIAVDHQASKDVATAFKFIALFEKRTETNSNDIDLRDCYDFIAAILLGKAPKQLNDESMYFIMRCFAKIGMKLKEENTTKEEEFVNSLKWSTLKQKTYVGKTSSVTNDPDLNALKVYPSLLKIKKDLSLL